MDDDERLREALLELKLLRGREAERLRETGALLSALEALTATREASAGIEALLASIRASLGCGLVALFEGGGPAMTLAFPADPELAGLVWEMPGLLTRPRRIVDIDRVQGLWQRPPEGLARWRSLLSVPLTDAARTMILVAFSERPAAFGAGDADLLERLATVASQAILRRRLEQRNAFLAAVIDEAPVSVAIAEVSADLPLVYVNDAFSRLTGYPREAAIGRNCRFLAVEPQDGPTRRDIRRTVARRAYGDFLVQNRRADGELFWNELRLFPIRRDDAEVTHIVATQTDATLRMRAEEQRDNARRRLEGALGAMSEGVLVLGRRGHVRFANAKFRDFFPDIDLPEDLPLDGTAAAAIFGPDAPGAGDAVPLLRQDVNRETVTAAGRQLVVRARPIPDGGAVIAASDITQSKVTERVLRQRLAAIEMSQDGIAIGDAEGRVVHANPSLVAMWNLADESEALGRVWTRFYDAASAARFRADAAAFEATGVWRGEVVATGVDFDAAATTAAGEGTARIHDVSLSLVPDVGTVLIAQDVTDRLRDAEERGALRRQLDRAQMQDRVNQITAGLAHDFNNLLSAIIGSATLIEALEGTPETARRAAGRIGKAAGRAAELVDGFLDLGQRERTAERIDLARVLRNTADLARGGAPAAVALSVDIPPGPLWIEASQTDILQVVMNLVVNGIDAIGAADGEVRLSLAGPRRPPEGAAVLAGTPDPTADYALIGVSDTGGGMEAATAARILEPYFTTKGNAGTGLGLAIVASILSANDALLQLDTGPNRGTTFTIWWPLGRKGSAGAVAPASGAGSRRNLPIMVLDDAPDVAAALAADLTAAGFEVAETHDPALALEAIAEDPGAWGCLVTDYDMPVLNGGDLAERLSVAAPNVPIVVVSALARRLTDRRLDRARDVLPKPVRADTLLAAVRRAVGWTEGEGGGRDADTPGR